MLQDKPIGRGLTGSILSLSLLTVMAGAAVAPALNVIQAHFAQSSQTFVQMIISIPALSSSSPTSSSPSSAGG